MNKIMLFGTGNFAKRHMEGIRNYANHVGNSQIYVKVWDDYLHSQMGNEVGQKILDDVFSSTDIHYVFQPPETTELFDVSIDSTNVNGRAGNLIVNSNLKLLEKPLANTLEGLLVIEKDVGLKKAKVNCARRNWKIYSVIKDWLKDGDNCFHLNVRLNKAGLLSNAVHFFDLFEWLSGMKLQNIQISKLQLFDSKRDGFNEGMGIISGCSCINGRDASVSIEDNCVENQDPSSVVEIVTSNEKIVVYETTGVVEKISGEFTEKSFFDPSENFQSKLTSKILRNHFNKIGCDLPDAEEFLRINKLFLMAISEVRGTVEFT